MSKKSVSWRKMITTLTKGKSLKVQVLFLSKFQHLQRNGIKTKHELIKLFFKKLHMYFMNFQFFSSFTHLNYVNK